MSPTHHAVNSLLTVVGITAGTASIIPGESGRVWFLFSLSVCCSLCYLIINARHLINALKDLFKKGTDDELPPSVK
jgi:hypothetical protein